MAQGGTEGRGRTVALAIGVPEFAQGRVFDREAISTFRESLKPMALPWLAARDLGRARGFRFLTADQVEDPTGVLLVSYDWTAVSQRLLEQGARAGVLVSLEPPLIAWSLYANLRRISARFPHTFLFEGARERVHPRSRFHALDFPQSYLGPDASTIPWERRKPLVMVNSNKRIVTSPGRWFDRPREVSLKRLLASLRYPPIRRDGYATRLGAIEHFARTPGFDLFGEGWERRHPAVSVRQHAAALTAYRGVAVDKLGLLGGYRFAFAIENTIYPGYVSEKLPDCFVAGTIPLYLGDPAVEERVPPASFVDLRGFQGNWPALERRLNEITSEEARAYLDAGASFLASPRFRERFTPEVFGRRIVTALEDVSAKGEPSP